MATEGSTHASTARRIATVTSLAVRGFAYVFLRWIPGTGVAPLIWTLLAAYVPSFLYSLLHTSPYNVISDEVKVVTRDVDVATAERLVDKRYASPASFDEPGQELDVEETVVLQRKHPQILKTLLLGTPSPSSLISSIATFTFNLALAAMVWDVVYRARLSFPSHELSMARVGYVSDSIAKVLVREPSIHELPVTVSYRYADASHSEDRTALFSSSNNWKEAGRISHLDNSTDYTSVITMTGLRPDTRYQWLTSNNQSGHFSTAPKIGHVSNRPSTPGVFTFLHTSCLKNRFPYNPLKHPLSNEGLQYLSQALSGLHAQFMLFLGDFIYADVPRRHGVSVEDFRREYRQIYASPDWANATRELPWIHVYDDHEIANDWSANTTSPFSQANDPYLHYHVAANPPPARPEHMYFTFTQGPASFFMLDTRRYRSPNDATDGADSATGQPSNKTMLGAQQMKDLVAWLRQPERPGVRWKVVVSSVPFTKNWWFNAQDTWRGYLGERQRILEAMWDVGLHGHGVGVVVLSGDRHEFAATAFPPPPNTQWPLSSTVHEFSASPLNMFYLPVRTYAQSPATNGHVSDVCIKYIPDGNSKFGAVSISSPATSDQSVLHYRLYVDGVEKWSYTVTTPPNLRGGSRSKDAIWG